MLQLLEVTTIRMIGFIFKMRVKACSVYWDKEVAFLQVFQRGWLLVKVEWYADKVGINVPTVHN